MRTSAGPKSSPAGEGSLGLLQRCSGPLRAGGGSRARSQCWATQGRRPSNRSTSRSFRQSRGYPGPEGQSVLPVTISGASSAHPASAGALSLRGERPDRPLCRFPSQHLAGVAGDWLGGGKHWGRLGAESGTSARLMWSSSRSTMAEVWPRMMPKQACSGGEAGTGSPAEGGPYCRSSGALSSGGVASPCGVGTPLRSTPFPLHRTKEQMHLFYAADEGGRPMLSILLPDWRAIAEAIPEPHGSGR